MTREAYIDIVKGLAIWCIVLLHYEQGIFPREVNLFIGSFMITAFYVTAGWVTAMKPGQTSFKELLAKRWRQLAIPYLWWTGIILAFDFLLYLCGVYSPEFLAREAYKSITLRGIGTLWFLPALFGGELIWYGLRRCRCWWILPAFGATLLYMYVYGTLLGGRSETLYRIIDAPFRTIANILNAWTGIAFGFYAYRFIGKELNRVHRLWLVGGGLLLCLAAYFCATSWPSCISLAWPYAAPLLGPLGFLLLAKAVQTWRPLAVLFWWGRNSLNLMVTHYSITLVLFELLVKDALQRPFSGWAPLLCFIASIPLQYLWVLLIDKLAPQTLGKSKTTA